MKIGERLKEILGVAAPTIGTALGGPLGGLAGTFVSKALGVDDEQAALAKIDSDPQAMVALKQADLDFQKHLADCKIDLEQIAADDRKDARARQIALKDNGPLQVLWLTSIGFFGTLGFMLVHGLPASGGEPLLIMVGALGSAWGAAITYFVGSSAGSSAKTELLAKDKAH